MTQRDGWAASLRCTGRRRGRGLVQVILFWLGLLGRVTFCAHLSHPQLSQQLVDLPGEFARQVGARVLVRHRGNVDQQPGVSPASFTWAALSRLNRKSPRT